MARVYAQWKELLIWDSRTERLVFEFAMGIPTISFPTRAVWAKASPAPAAHYDRVLEDVSAWAQREGVPLIVEDRTWINVFKK